MKMDIVSLIPTPQEQKLLRGSPKIFAASTRCRILTAGAIDPRTELAVKRLRTVLACLDVDAQIDVLSHGRALCLRPTDIVLCSQENAAVAALLPEHLRRFDMPNAEQAYALHSDADTPVILYAHSSAGLLHAVATLLQLLGDAEGNDYQLPNISIRDFPMFRFRGNNWNLFGEVGGWSHDRGDGPAAYEQRIARKLDLCWEYKINLVIFDGLGWGTTRFEGYAPMMQRLNSAARQRGVRLLYTGYGSGYGAGCNCSESFRNRERYPDGPAYSCCGAPDNAHDDIAQTMGTCLSNRALLALKQKELVAFVEQVEPGAMYIHNLDASRVSESEALWQARCPACRERWPNDEIAAADGMAGAFAWFYDALADSINQIANPQSGYRADRDCLLFMISPNYSSYDATDEEWQAHCDYFEALACELRNPNIVLGLREQFSNIDKPGGRYAQLRRQLDRTAPGTAFGGFCFMGGGGYYNNLPYIASPVLTSRFEGADAIVHANGNGFQEPQQLLNAEYSWNPCGSAFHVEGEQDSHQAFLSRYGDLVSGRARPAALFAPGGFLDQACLRLYGATSGPKLAAIHRLSGTKDMKRLGRCFHRASVLLPLWNTLMPTSRFSTFRREGVDWRPELSDPTWEALHLLRDACREMCDLNRRAAHLAASAVEGAPTPEIGCDIAWFESELRIGARLAACVALHLDVFEDAHRIALSGNQGKRQVLKTIARLRQRLTRLRRAMRDAAPGPAIDYQGGDIGFRERVVADLRRQLRNMVVTLNTGKWIPPKKSSWW